MESVFPGGKTVFSNRLTRTAQQMDLQDTIVAVSSPAGAAERAIVRLSGERAMAIAERLFVPEPRRVAMPPGEAEPISTWPTYTARAGRVVLPGEGLSAPALAYLMRAPKSYTRGDVVELHVGGWPAVVPLVLEGLMAAGARAAEPGEFTFRALVSGRLDLAQAEAVMAVVDAGSRAALRAAGDLLAGHLSREVSHLADRAGEVLALVEAGLDFSDQDIALAPPEEIAARIADLRTDLAGMGRRARSIETFGGEVRLVLAGWPNVGKSSLFNRLLACDRAIVTPVPGTTRDELRSRLHAGGMTFTLSDVAGLDEARDELDGTAHARAVEAIGRADLVILALEATAPSYDRTDELLSLVAAPMVVAVTKCDLAPPDGARQWLRERGADAEVVATSAVTGEGIEELTAALVRAVAGGTVDRQAAGPVVTARHRAAVEQAAAALARAARVARRPGGAGELVAVELNETLRSLGTIIGRKAGGDVLEAIFSRFCIGK